MLITMQQAWNYLLSTTDKDNGDVNINSAAIVHQLLTRSSTNHN
jgi:hypothetical protein